MKKLLFMETTQISAEKTAAEVTAVLVKSGARRLMTEYGADKQICGLRFELDVNGKPWVCVLPAREEPVFKIINGRRSTWDRKQVKNVEKDRATARRVAWRQLLRWIQAQIAMIETGMVEPGEVFMPYVEVAPGVTAYQSLISNPSRLLAAPTQAEFV